MAKRVFPVAVLLMLIGVMVAPFASAHRGDQSYLYLDIGDELVARLQMPFIDVADALGIELNDYSESAVLERIAANADALESYALDHVELAGPDGAWALTPVDVDRAAEGLDYVQVTFDVDHGVDFQNFTLRLDPFFDEIDERDALLLVANDLGRGVIDNEAEHLIRFTPDSRTQAVDLGNASQWTNFRASVSAGIDHIRTGPDHVLFVVALLIPSVLVWRNGWKPASGFLSTLWRIAKIMTMFTLAHSVTFTLAGLGVLPSPGAKVTETIIALSIAATALHTLRPVFIEREWVISFAFGLFHGFGFASLVNELEVGTTTQLISLAGRNVGIEIGQLIVVLLVFPMLYLLRRTPAYRPLVVVSSIGLAAVALIWMFERLTERNARVTSVVDELVQFPRVLVIVLVATIAAAMMRKGFNDRLLPVAESTLADGERELLRESMT